MWQRGECSVLVALEAEGGPIGAQTWDWHEELAATWLVWGLETAAGMRVQTLTEAGMLAKIGINSAGHRGAAERAPPRDDASVPLGVPIHVLLRRLLAESETIFDAVRILAAAPVAASSAVTLIAAEGGEETALTAELRPGAAPEYVLPDESGLLVHTNHFLSPAAVPGAASRRSAPIRCFASSCCGAARRACAARVPAARRSSPPSTATSAPAARSAATPSQAPSPATATRPSPPSSSIRSTGGCVSSTVVPARRPSPAGPKWTSQSPPPRRPSMYARIDNVDLLCTDVEKIKDFYHGLLGLPLHFPYEPGSGWVALDAGNLTLFVFETTNADREDGARRRTR